MNQSDLVIPEGYIVIQETLEEGQYYFSNNKWSGIVEEAQVFADYCSAEKARHAQELYWQTHPHPPGLTILGIGIVRLP